MAPAVRFPRRADASQPPAVPTQEQGRLADKLQAEAERGSCLQQQPSHHVQHTARRQHLHLPDEHHRRRLLRLLHVVGVRARLQRPLSWSLFFSICFDFLPFFLFYP